MKLSILLSVLAIAGCSGNDDPPIWQGTMDTLPGGAVLVSNPAAGLWDSAAAWTLTEELVIGPDIDSLNSLSEITAIEADSAGRTYILERKLPAILVYDSMGGLIKRIGRDGDGPGEFRQPNGLGWDRLGRLWVTEGRQHRWSMFDREGNHLATQPRPIGSYGYYWFGRFLKSGELIDELPGRRLDDRTQPMVARYDSLRGMVDTLALPYTLTGENNFKLEHADGYTVMPIPFHPSWLSHIDARGFIWIGNTGRYELIQLNLNGDTIRVVRKDQPSIPVTEAERDSAIKHIRNVAQGAEFDAGRIPRVKPVLERLLVDDAGYLYVMTPEQAGMTGTGFDVFDPDGRFLGRVRTQRTIGPWRPAAPMVARWGKVWSVVVDDDDVPSVVRWKVQSP